MCAPMSSLISFSVHSYVYVHVCLHCYQSHGHAGHVPIVNYHQHRMGAQFSCIWVRSRRCGCLVTWFCYHLIAKPGNKTAAPSWPDPYIISWDKAAHLSTPRTIKLPWIFPRAPLTFNGLPMGLPEIIRVILTGIHTYMHIVHLCSGYGCHLGSGVHQAIFVALLLKGLR